MYTTFFQETGRGKYVPRAIYVDLEPTVIGERQCRVVGSSGAGSWGAQVQGRGELWCWVVWSSGAGSWGAILHGDTIRNIFSEL